MSTPQPSTPVPVPSPKKAPVGAIAGGVVGGVAVLGLIGLGLIVLLKRKRRNQSPIEQSNLAQPDLLKSEGSLGSPPLASNQYQPGPTSKSAMVEQISSVSSSAPYTMQYQHYPQQPQQYQSAVEHQHWAPAAPQPVEMESPDDTLPPQYGSFSPGPTNL
jgi:hypothetical protein